MVEELEKALESGKSANSDGGDFDKIKEVPENLKKAMMELGEKASNSATSQNPNIEDVIDTDFSAEKK